MLDFGCGDGLIVRGAADAYGYVVGVDALRWMNLQAIFVCRWR